MSRPCWQFWSTERVAVPFQISQSGGIDMGPFHVESYKLQATSLWCSTRRFVSCRALARRVETQLRQDNLTYSSDERLRQQELLELLLFTL